MQIRELFLHSYSYKVLSSLFSDKASYLVTESLAGKVAGKAYIPYATEICLLLSVVLFWYEGFFSLYIPFLSKGYIASALLLAALVFSKKERLVFKKSHLWLLGFLTVSLVSALLAAGRGIDGKLLISGWMLFAQFGFALFAAQSLEKINLYKLLVWLSVPLSAVGLYQFFFRVETPSVWLSSFERDIDTRAFAFFGSPNVLGILLAIVSIVAIGLYIESRNKRYLVLTALSILTVLFTFSRSAWFGLIAGLFLMILVYKPKLTALSPLVLLVFLFSQARNRIAIVFSDRYIVDSSLDGRVWSFINGMHIFKKYPLLGTGSGSYGGVLAANSSSPVYLESMQKGYAALYFTDNQHLEILVQTGILGFIVFFGFLISVFWMIVNKFKEKKDIMVLASGASLVCFVVSGVFANVLEFGAVAVPMGAVLGYSIRD